MNGVIYWSKCQRACVFPESEKRLSHNKEVGPLNVFGPRSTEGFLRSLELFTLRALQL